jgi:hypothetical protein
MFSSLNSFKNLSIKPSAAERTVSDRKADGQHPDARIFARTPKQRA